LAPLTKRSFFALCAASWLLAGVTRADACTRVLYVGDDGTAITGRTMDWKEDMSSNVWAFPAGIARDGGAGPNSIHWVSKYGSVGVSGYEAGIPDGMNVRGLVANVLYLAEAQYPRPVAGKPNMSIAYWAQYALDNFATVSEAVSALRAEPFNLLAPKLPNGAPATFHLALSDATGDSAVLEYDNYKLVIYHDRKYKVMTNSPTYDKQLALDEYWKGIGGLTFLPGTNRAADRFARASFLLSAIPKKIDPHYLQGVPGQSYAYQAVASVLSVVRAVSVPLGITTPDQPNISSTIWRTVSDQTRRVYYFDSATRPNTFWVSLDKLDLKPGAPIRKLTIAGGQVFSGEVAGAMKESKPLQFLPATP
jgi:penicillin V acylase-like amidase (Ntn superfamily)